MRRVPPQRFAAKVEALFATIHPGSFATTAVASLPLGFDGISDDRHGGFTRRTGGREPWYPRGTEIRNERQLSLLSLDDLAAIATGMGVAEVRPEWIGGNMLIGGVRDFTLLPPRTCFFFEGGATIRIDGLNVPCRSSGRSVAAHYPDREGLDLGFVKAARQRRGLVGWVEKPGTVKAGDSLEIRVPEQFLYESNASG